MIRNTPITHYIGVVIQNGTRFYLSRQSPLKNKVMNIWIGWLDPNKAHQFKTKDAAVDALSVFVQDKPYIVMVGIAEVSYYPVDRGQKKV
jgi:hypothetical protein